MFLPTDLASSIVMPQQDVIITLRNATNVKNIPLAGWFTTDIALLAKKLVVRTIDYAKQAKDLKQISDHVSLHLSQLHASERLNLIGGYQASPTSVDCLMYREDNPADHPIQLLVHNLTCEQWGVSDE